MIRTGLYKVLFIALMLFPVACSATNKKVLEHKDVQFFKTEEIKHNKTLSLKISGLAFHSSLAVSGIYTKLESSSLLVYVYLTPAKEGLSGSFSYEVHVPDSTNEVCFGNEKVVIWKHH